MDGRDATGYSQEQCYHLIADGSLRFSPVQPTDHQELLELLRTLNQGVKFSGSVGRNHEFSGTTCKTMAKHD